jgi:hypothetical protein
MDFSRKKGMQRLLMVRKLASMYTALFEKVKIEIDTKGLNVQVLLKENMLNESQIIRIYF